MFLTRISIKHPVFATMIMIAIAVFGYYSYNRLPIENLPDVEFPVVVAVVSYPGAAPEAVENDVVKPIEDAVNTINGIDEIRSTAQANQAMVVLIFDMDIDTAVAAQDVRDKLATLTGTLPDGADEPMILRFDPNQLPIMSLAVSSSELSTRELTALTDDIILKRLSVIQGVGSASAIGDIPRQLNIDIDSDKLIAYNVSLSQISTALAQANKNLPAGDISNDIRIQSVQVDGEFKDPTAYLDEIIAYQNGLPIFLKDVATLTDGEADPSSVALLDGKQALAINIIKVQGANTVDVAENVRSEINKLMANDLPDSVEISIVQDNSTEVEESFSAVINMLIEGALLTVFIVFLFLNSWRSTVITGLTLPISIIGTMIVLHILGFTLNMMTLMALSLAVGLLIDDAIVVRENIMRHLHMGKSHFQAAMEGTDEIGLAVLATTLSIVAVFLPVAFMDGILGRFFLQFGVTVSVAVLISLFVAFTLDPMLSSVWYDPSAAKDAKRGVLGRMVEKFDNFFTLLSKLYTKLLRWCLRHRVITLVATLCLVVGSFSLVPRVGAEFVPAVDNSQLQIDFETPQGSTIEYTSIKATQIHKLIEQRPEVTTTYTTINGSSTGGTAAENVGTIVVSLVKPDERELSALEMTSIIREELIAIPGITYNVGISSGFGGIEAPVQINLAGESFETLDRISKTLMAQMAKVKGISDIESSYDTAKPVVGIEINTEAANDLGVSQQQIAAALRPMINGSDVSEWTSPEGDTVNVNIRLAQQDRANIELLKQLPISQSGVTGSTSIVRLEQVAKIIESTGPVEIERSDMERQVVVSANLDGVGLGDVTGDLNKIIENLNKPIGYTVKMGGDSEQLQETGLAAISALGLAIILIYLVLASQFGSFLQPIAIMFSLPLAITGVLIGLLVGGSTLNLYSIIGFIMLMGLVVKNAILLVDNCNQHMSAGYNIYDALVNAGKTRFRPIIMTTLAMIFGMLPMALNLEGGTGQNQPMAHAVIGGLISSTLLTLIVVPVILTYIHSLGNKLGRLFASQSAALHAEHAE